VIKDKAAGPQNWLLATLRRTLTLTSTHLAPE
jgi:hypothetical protein